MILPDLLNRKKEGLLWLVVFFILLLFNLLREPLQEAPVYATLTILFYAAIIYFNAYVLIPEYLSKSKYYIYACAALFFLLAITLVRTLAGIYIFNSLFAIQKNSLTVKNFAFHLLSGVFVLLFSFFYRITHEYYVLKEKEARLHSEKIKAELFYLKQQVNPHFLFNTLNNIYYEVQKKSQSGADLIERLSVLMRYFMLDARKQTVALTDEVELIKSYIALEKLRLHFDMPFTISIPENIENAFIPPLIMIPLVENIFKHGVDQKNNTYKASLTITCENKRVCFRTENDIATRFPPDSKTALGLNNLIKRLTLHYEDDFLFTYGETPDKKYLVTLDIPCYENVLYHN